MDVYVSETNIGFWKVVMQGPPRSPYADGVFVLTVEMTSRFPLAAPEVRFITPILHPNITKHGRICHPIFDREWRPNIHVYEVLQHMWSLLMSFEIRDAIEPMFTLKTWTAKESAHNDVSEYIKHFASTSRAKRSVEITGDHPSANFQYCLRPGCNSGQERVAGTNSTLVVCIACGHQMCFSCCDDWHADETCDQYLEKRTQKWDKMTEEWLVANTKKCPGCTMSVVSDAGCYHMTCVLCRFQFCWMCLADFSEIKEKGPSAHKEGCSFRTSGADPMNLRQTGC